MYSVNLLRIKTALYQILAGIALGLSVSSFALNNLRSADSYAQAKNNTVKKLNYEIIAVYPHDNRLYTQGLEFYQNSLFESAGQYGQSQILRYSVDFNREPILNVENSKRIPAKYFAEGLSVVNGDLWLLTWKRQQLFTFNTLTFAITQVPFLYDGEGWGLSYKGDNRVIRSDGTPSLKIHSVEDMQLLSSHPVYYQGRLLNYWNELEWFEPKLSKTPLLIANRWLDNSIYLINLNETSDESAFVLAMLDLSELAKKQPQSAEVLNGIAWNDERQTLWVTGKYWPHIYELKIHFKFEE